MSQEQMRDAVLYRMDAADRQRLAAFFNLASNAASYGMVMGSARTGLGTALPVGTSIPGLSLYYQALHSYSAFDWEFQRLLIESEEAEPLPEEIALLAGRFPEAFVEGLTDEDLKEVGVAQRFARAAIPNLRPFAFRMLGENAQALSREAGGIRFSEEAREALWRGTRAKLELIDARACSPNAAALEDKLLAMAQAFAPLCTMYAAHFDNEKCSESFTRLKVYLPALHSLHADDVDDPSGWHLERGIASLELPAPLQVRAARITHASYLASQVREREQGIRLEVRRDFSAPQRVTLQMGFGHYFSSSSEDLLGFDASEAGDALHLRLHGHVPVEAGDSVRVRTAKERANKALEGFSVEARVHILTLHLMRDEVEGGDEQLLRPQFSLEESKMSFRIERIATNRAERLSLQAAGFSWDELESGEGYRCWREFWTWDRLREFFGGEEGSGLGTMFVTGREKLLGQVIGRATKVVLDHSIESIEKSLDEEIARLVGEGLQRYATARDVLASRLHAGLF